MPIFADTPPAMLGDERLTTTFENPFGEGMVTLGDSICADGSIHAFEASDESWLSPQPGEGFVAPKSADESSVDVHLNNEAVSGGARYTHTVLFGVIVVPLCVS